MCLKCQWMTQHNAHLSFNIFKVLMYRSTVIVERCLPVKLLSMKVTTVLFHNLS